MNSTGTESRAGVIDPSQARLMATIAGVLYLIGSLLVGAVLLLPSAEGDPHRMVIALALAGPLAVGAGLLLWGSRLPPIGFHLTAVFATAVVTAFIHLSDNPASPFALLYAWVVGWAAVFLTPRALAAHVAFVALAYAAVLLPATHAGDAAARWLLTMGTLGGAAVLISLLTVAIRRHTGHLETTARTDALTGLPNRRAWNEALPHELERAAREQISLSVAILDLDHFKEFNDRCGHQAGDRLLREAAMAWRGRVRSADLLTRYGGEEFALLLPGCALPKASVIVEELRHMVPGGESCSAGVAEWTPGESAEMLLARADDALYAAKRTGRDRLVLALATSEEGGHRLVLRDERGGPEGGAGATSHLDRQADEAELDDARLG